MRCQNLDRNRAVQSRIPGPVHFTHSTRTKLRLDLVGSKFEARAESHRLADYIRTRPRSLIALNSKRAVPVLPEVF